jgi:hypothetical protein
VREELAEQLLGSILDWDTPTAKNEIAALRYLAAVKYDGYRNFEPGHRFLESLALWLRNYDTIQQKRIAYNFMKSKMFYISENQMDHLVGLLYPQRILPILMDRARVIGDIPEYQTNRILKSPSFAISLRKTLFFALSDGARLDAFRRKNALSNEQVCVSYELNNEKLLRLYNDLEKWLQENHRDSAPCFENIFLIDDFSGSGYSILHEDPRFSFGGKVFRFVNEVLSAPGGGLIQYCEKNGVNLFVATYLATDKAVNTLSDNLIKLKEFSLQNKLPLSRCEVLKPLQSFGAEFTISDANNSYDIDFDSLLRIYYDDRIEDSHTRTGGHNLIHGYSDCGLPLVLCHNTPNNSVYLLWATTPQSDGYKGLHALFPRISRHFESR